MKKAVSFLATAAMAVTMLSVAAFSPAAEGGEVLYQRPDDARIYADFNTAFNAPSWEWPADGVASGDGTDGKVHILSLEAGATQTVADGAATFTLPADSAVRFQNTLLLSKEQDGKYVSAYNYMVIRMKGTVAAPATSVNGEYTNEETGVTSHTMGFGFGGAANATAKGLVFRSGGYGQTYAGAKDPEGEDVAQITDQYQTFIIDLQGLDCFDQDAQGGNNTQLWLRNIGPYTKTLTIDEIYFTNTVPAVDEGENPGDDGDDGQDQPVVTDPDIPEDAEIYADFNTALELGVNTASGNGADGWINLFAINNGTQTVEDSLLKLDFPDASSYIRFTNSLELTSGTTADKFQYMAIKLKGSATWGDGSPVVDGNFLKVVFGSFGNEANAAYIPTSQVKADEFTTVYIELNDQNFAATHADFKSGLILYNAGGFHSNLEIDSIFFTNTKPADNPDDNPGSDPGEEPDDGDGDNTDVATDPDIPKDAEVYADFNTALQLGANTASGNGADGWINLFAINNGTQTVEDGVLKLDFTAADSHIRFTNSLELTSGTKADQFKYMAIKLKGSATWNDGNPVTEGDLLKVIFGSWGNEANFASIPVSQVKADEFTTVYIELKDEYFANTHADYKSGLILYNAGGFHSTVEIDHIFFTNTKPAEGSGEGEGNPDTGVASSLAAVALLASGALGTVIVSRKRRNNVG